MTVSLVTDGWLLVAGRWLLKVGDHYDPMLDTGYSMLDIVFLQLQTCLRSSSIENRISSIFSYKHLSH